MRTSFRASLLSLFVATSAFASAATKVKADAEDQARGQIQDLLRSLCPEQCLLVSVEAKVEEETVAAAAPGFDAPASGAKLPTLRSINASMVLDSELPMAFRTRLKGLVLQKLQPFTPQANVNVESVK